MSVDFSFDRWEEVKDTYRRWWAGDLGRPIVFATLNGRNPGRDEPELPYEDFVPFYDTSVPVEKIVDRWDYDLSCGKYLGDSFPTVGPNFGAGVAAAFLGARLRPERDGGTVWFEPVEEMDIADIHFEYDADNVWLRRVKDLVAAAVDRWEGMVQIDMTDLGGNLDILSSFLPGEKLLLNLYDHPDQVQRLLWEAHELWHRYFAEINAILQPANPGYTAWPHIFCEEPTYMLQCDFCYMISPEMFDTFVRPELAATCGKLTRSFYHLDGPGQLAHLDSLLEIERLDGIQWIAGAGQPQGVHWMDVYRRIHDAGKLAQLFGVGGSFDLLDQARRQIGSVDNVVYMVDGSADQERQILREIAGFAAP